MRLKLLFTCILLLLCATLSMMIGSLWISPMVMIKAFFYPDPMSTTEVIVHSARLSRTVLAISSGAMLAVAGALMQALTRNPLASPGIFGVNAGATFFVVLAGTLFSVSSQYAYLFYAFAGASTAGALVWFAVNFSYSRLDPLKLVLAGVAITALFSAFSQAILVINQERLDNVLFWLAGSLTQSDLTVSLPIIILSYLLLILALLASRQLDVLTAGDEIAIAVGQHIARIRFMVSLLVIGLAGCAVTLAGNIGFIGLLVPHIARKLFGINHCYMLPACALSGAILLLIADMLARVVILPQEVPVGVITSLIGAPFFIMLARRRNTHG